MSADRSGLTQEILNLLEKVDDSSSVLSPRQHVHNQQTSDSERSNVGLSHHKLDFGLMFFAASTGDEPGSELYGLVKKAAAAADHLGLSGLWLPERHFHRFGGPYPAPAVLAAALAGITEHIHLRTGSITLPLNHPVRVVEAWSMIDHLSKGRVELGFGSGWSPNDFILAPDCFVERKTVFQERIDQVRRLWRGESVSFVNGEGETVPVRVYPAPLQSEPPIWVTATGNPETFAWAGANGCNLLTMLLGMPLRDIATRVKRYRAARQVAGLDPAGGRVALMLHCLVHPDEERVMAAIREPFTAYVRNALDAQRGATQEGRELDKAQAEQMVAYATERYIRTAALFGSPATCLDLLDEVAAADIDEVACLIDFGPDDALVLEGLPYLADLRDRWNSRAAASAHEPEASPVQQTAGPVPIAVIGMSGILPGVPNSYALHEAIQNNTVALRSAPEGRFGDIQPSLSVGGFIDGIELFDPTPFGLAAAEAAAMDPHQRLLLSMAYHCLLDAGLPPDSLAGAALGVFTALYSDSFAARRANDVPDPLEAIGRVHALGPNRISHAFDLAGPSEVIATACSSGLVAVHRALGALRSGECEMALVCATSLLLSDGESQALRALGVLSPNDRCYPFDRTADGQCRGEGAAALLLKPLAAAVAAGDPIHAVVLGSATNHSGAASGSLVLPNANRQATCIASALANANVSLGSIGYIEAHGAGSSAGDHAELAALAELWRSRDDSSDAIAIASGKAATGSLDAVGGLAGMLRAIVATRDGILPALACGGELGDDSPIENTPFYLNRQPVPWSSRRRRASVHAYGLGGVNAHVILEAPPENSRPGPLPARAEPVVLSATSTSALKASARELAQYLRRPDAPALGHIAHTLRTGRPIEKYWWWTVATSTQNLIERLEALADGRDSPTPVPVESVLQQIVTALAAARSPQEVRVAVSQTPPVVGARRVSLPPPVQSPLRFPLDGGAVVAVDQDQHGPSPVADFYDYVTRDQHKAAGEIYLTLAPFPEPVPGFSWTCTMQNPGAHPDHYRLMLARQREMRDVAFADVDLTKVRRVMDIGCGLGTDLIMLAKNQPELEGVGYTLSPAQAHIAAARIAMQGLNARLSIHERDSSRTPFPGSFDLIFGFEVAHHIADKDGLFSHIAKALADHGHLVLADTVAGTVAPVSLQEVGSHTLPHSDYAELFARHGLLITSCIDLSQEIANFLLDPHLERMLADEAQIATDSGQAESFPLAAAVQRSWNAFGEALREGLMYYVLIHACRAPAGSDPRSVNLQQLEVS